MPEADFDNLDLPPTGTQPVGVPGAAPPTRRQGTARHPGSPSGLEERGVQREWEPEELIGRVDAA